MAIAVLIPVWIILPWNHRTRFSNLLHFANNIFGKLYQMGLCDRQLFIDHYLFHFRN